MKLSTTAALMLIFSLALAFPVLEKRQTITDVGILQYALTLEHLENVFYKSALPTIPEQPSSPPISPPPTPPTQNPSSTTQNPTSNSSQPRSAPPAPPRSPPAPTTSPPPPLTPTRPSPPSSNSVGTSDYLTGAALIASKEHLGVAGSILVTEAQHTSLQRLNLGEVAPANPYGTALGLDPVHTLAAAFITRCPAVNAPLSVKPFPSLVDMRGNPAAPGGVTFEAQERVPAGVLCGGL